MALATLEHQKNVALIRPGELSGAELCQWRAIQSAAELSSPFFSPDYFQLIDEVRHDVHIALLEGHNGLAGFYPFQRQRRAGLPVGYPLSDFQGAIVQPDLALDEIDLLRQCKLDSFQFNHWTVGQPLFGQYYWQVHHSPYIDLSLGFEAYADSIARRGGSFISSTRRKARKLEREVGPLRLELHTTCNEAFEQLMRWKSQQYHELRAVDLFDFAWVRELCDRVRFHDQADFRGLMTALYAGDHLVAVHLGLSTNSVAHMWFPAYNPTFDRYSPGMILLLKLIERLATQGISRLDLGKGHERFKEACKSADSQVAVGAIDRNRWRAQALHMAYKAKCWAWQYPTLHSMARVPMRWFRSCYRHSAMR